MSVEPRDRFVHPAAVSREPFERRYVTTDPGAELDRSDELRRWFGEHPGDWLFRIDGHWLFCWRIPRVDTAEEITTLLTTLAGIADRLPDKPEPPFGPKARPQTV